MGAPDEPFMEGWTVLSALAAVTRRIRLATLATSVGYRNPAHLAKIAAGVDLISRGRLTLGIGAGYFETEYRQYGWEFPARPAVRIRQMEGAVRLILALWTERRTTFHGRYFQGPADRRYAYVNQSAQRHCAPKMRGDAGNKLPKGQQPKAKRALQEIWMAETSKDAEAAFDAFIAAYELKYDKAAECLAKDRQALFAFYDFPAEHWKHLRTSKPDREHLCHRAAPHDPLEGLPLE